MFDQNTLKRKNIKLKTYLQPAAGVLEKEKVRLSEIFSSTLASRTIGLWIISALTLGSQVAITLFMPSGLVSEGFTVVNSLFYSMVINIGELIGAILSSYFASKLGRKLVLGPITIYANRLYS